jgi:hypothetical protein
MALTKRRKMNDKIGKIVYMLHRRRSLDENCRLYKNIKFLREGCDGSANRQNALKDLIEQINCLALLKKDDNIQKYNHYKKLAVILTILYDDVGIPVEIRNIFKIPQYHTSASSSDFIDRIASSSEASVSEFTPIHFSWSYCKLMEIPGIGQKSIGNIVHWWKNGFIYEVRKAQSMLVLHYGVRLSGILSNNRRDSKKDILIKQLQDSVKRLVEDNRSLRGSEEVEECSICLESEGLLVPSKCGHKFHTECLVKWLENKNTCPNCRENIVD